MCKVPEKRTKNGRAVFTEIMHSLSMKNLRSATCAGVFILCYLFLKCHVAMSE